MYERFFRRMHDYKVESNNQQVQLDKIRKEMELLQKEYKNCNVNSNFEKLKLFYFNSF